MIFNLPTLGSKVDYLRVDADGTTHEGEGFVTALLLDHTKRIVVRVQDGEHAWNIDAPAVNANKQAKEAYIEHVLGIRSRADEINAQLKEMTAKGNEAIEEMNTKFFGKPVDMEEEDAEASIS